MMAVFQLCKPDKHVSARMSTRTEPLSGIKQAMAMSSGKQKWSATYLMALVHSSFMLRSHSIRAMSSWSLPPGVRLQRVPEAHLLMSVSDW